MKYHLAQLNLAKFRQPTDHPNNKDFVDSLDRVNEIAELQPGFVWRLTGEGNDALDVHAFEDPNIAVNMSVWEDLESLSAFVYRNSDHLSIMQRRKAWFDTMDFYLVLWWVPKNHTPTIAEAKDRLVSLERNGATASAFTFRHPFLIPSAKSSA